MKKKRSSFLTQSHFSPRGILPVPSQGSSFQEVSSSSLRKREPEIPDQKKFGPLTVVSRRAMATDFEVLLNDPSENGYADISATQIALDALDQVDRVENILSVFRSGSLVSRINTLASEIDIEVTEEFLQWLKLSLSLGEKTDGAFDIASGSLWKGWGFARREGRFPTNEEREKSLALSGTRHICIDDEKRAVRLDQEGVILNFGGIGKGIALDLAAQTTINAGLTDFLIQGGKSGAIARGGRRGDWSATLQRDMWTIHIADPLNHRPLAMVRLADQALATSGSAEQFFIYQGKRYSHILNPQTGFPASGFLSVTILADTAAEADALSTAFFVMGEQNVRQYCQDHPEISAFLVTEEKNENTRLIALNMKETQLVVLANELPFEMETPKER